MVYLGFFFVVRMMLGLGWCVVVWVWVVLMLVCGSWYVVLYYDWLLYGNVGCGVYWYRFCYNCCRL